MSEILYTFIPNKSDVSFLIAKPSNLAMFQNL